MLVKLGVRTTVAKCHWFCVRPLTPAVTVSAWVPFESRVKLAGATVSVIPAGVMTEAVQVTGIETGLVLFTVRVHEQLVAQAPSPMLAMFRVLGSPPALGLAAV